MSKPNKSSSKRLTSTSTGPLFASLSGDMQGAIKGVSNPFKSYTAEESNMPKLSMFQSFNPGNT